ncbi:MAG: tetratricopeptide repeat protein, partial [Candidatus Eremiobacteraeota bacterium]|nr:tetratricopeptide repeat protein [Candidatus Eremiobacteraeota bacterium]
GTLDAAAHLIASEVAGLTSGEGLIASLADKHLIALQPADRGRFSMLETIREYAHEQLAASDRLDRASKSFAAYYAALAKTAEPHLVGPEASRWFATLASEYENLRAALGWAVAHDRSLGLRVALSLRYYWGRRGLWVEALSWMNALVEPLASTLEALEPSLQWQVVNLLALTHHWVGDDERARPLREEALRMAREQRDENLIARSLNNLGGSVLNLGDFSRARRLQEEALEIKLRRGDDAWSVATTLGNLGMALRACHEYPLALDSHRQALELFRSAGDPWGEIAELNDIADIHRDQGESVQAARFYRESLDKNADELRPLIADSFEGLAAASAQRGLFLQTALLGGAADTIHKESGRSISLPDRPPFDAACKRARQRLGAPAFDDAWSEGAALPLPEAIEIARTIAADISGL